MRHLLVLLPLAVAVFSQEHFIDVRALVKDTIDAIKEVPQMMNQNQTTSTTSSSSSSSQSDVSTPEPTKMAKARADVYDSLLKLPGDIMSQFARDAGFVDEKTQKAQQAEMDDEKKQENRVEKKKEEEESYSFKTVDDMKTDEGRQVNERPTLATKKLDDNDDIFSISKLISATGNAIREAQAAQAVQQPSVQPQVDPMITLPPLVPLPPAPLQMPPALQMQSLSPPATEIMYRPVTKDGKTVYEQVVVLKDANGSVKLLPNTLLPELPVEVPKPLEVKAVKKEGEFLAPTFPPAINLFDQLTSTTAASTTTKAITTTEEPETTTEVVKPRRKSFPRRKIQYLEKKAKDMHSRQFGAKTVQMNDPIEIQAQEEQEPINILQKEGNLRVHAINRRRKSRKPRVVKVEVEEETKVEETTEPPKKRRKTLRKHKKVVKKEIRKLPDLYDEQWKTQVAPSVSPPSENFAEQFDGVDEVQEAPKRKEQDQPQNDTPMNDPIEQRSSKVQMLTKDQEEELINKEIRKRVMHRIRLSKLKTTTTEEPTTTTTEEPTTTTEKPTTEKIEMEEEVEESSADDVFDDEELEEEVEDEEEDLTTSTTTTTTEAPTTRAHRNRKNKKRAVVTKHQCLNLRSFARQFLFDTVEDFAKEHCYFIENYYPALTCARSHAYVAKCQRWLKEE